MNDEATAIFNHYFCQLAKRAGLRWSERNQADIVRACDLLRDAEPELDELPPYERPMAEGRRDSAIVSDRVTQVIERDGNDGIPDETFQRWRSRQEAEDVRRLVRR